MSFRSTLGLAHVQGAFSQSSRRQFSTIPPSFFSPCLRSTTTAAAGPSRRPLVSSHNTLLRTLSVQRTSFQQQPPFASALLRRAFSTSRNSLIRSTYFPKGSSSGGGGGYGGGGQGWFTRLRKRIDRIPTMTLVYGLIGLNGAVFLLWQYAISSAQRFRDPSLFIFLQKNFILNEINVFSGRVWTLVTSAFSHMSGSHIFVNCLGLYFLAPAAAGIMGSSAFLGLYLGAGVFSSLTSLTYHRLKQDRWMGSEGASGAIYACLSFYGALFPQSTVLMFFIVPMPVWAAISGIFAWDFYSALARPNSGTDSAGHLGGIIYGLGAALALRRGGFLRMFRGGARPRW